MEDIDHVATWKKLVGPYSWELKNAQTRTNPLRDDAPINDSAEAERVLQASLDQYGRHGIGILSSRERELISSERLAEMLQAAPDTQALDPNYKIKQWIAANTFTILTIKQMAEAAGVTYGQMKKWVDDNPWRFKTHEKRTYEVLAEQK